MSRLALLLMLLAVPAVGLADTDPRARSAPELLTALEAPKATADQRRQLAEQLAALGPDAIEALKAHLQRTRSSADADRRELLRSLGADVPDEQGRFRAPGRGAEDAPSDSLDWLAALIARGGSDRAFTEALSDIATIRALAATRAPLAGTIILNFAFADAGVGYRDECGRYLRIMAPWSLPALIKGSNSLRDQSKRRYANYQLERLDRENPDKAMRYADSDDLRVAILQAWGTTEDRRAVLTVLDHVNDVSPPVRAAARAAWMDYVTGPPPPEAPKKQLTLTGGKLAEEETPLWLTSRELADIFLHERYEKVLGEKPERRATLEQLSEALFAHYDAARDAARDAELERALQLAQSGDLAAAVAMFDEVLASSPLHPRRREAADAYATYGKQLAADKQWHEAAIAFGKAYAVAPDETGAGQLLAEQYYAQGRAHAAEGDNATADFARALELDPRPPRRQRGARGLRPGRRRRGGRRRSPAPRVAVLRRRRRRRAGPEPARRRPAAAPRLPRLTMLVVLEGIDGAGTTTQTRRLAAALTADGRSVHRTREPSDGPIGLLLRRMLAGEHAPVGHETMALLFAADRADHLQREVEPALARGSLVISDRWYHSSLAYQGSDADRAWIRTLNERMRRPDLTLFLRCDAEVAARRRADAGRDEESLRPHRDPAPGRCRLRGGHGRAGQPGDHRHHRRRAARGCRRHRRRRARRPGLRRGRRRDTLNRCRRCCCCSLWRSPRPRVRPAPTVPPVPVS